MDPVVDHRRSVKNLPVVEYDRDCAVAEIRCPHVEQYRDAKLCGGAVSSALLCYPIDGLTQCVDEIAGIRT